VPNTHGVNSQDRLKELARERARRQRDSELRVAGDSEDTRPPLTSSAD